MTYRQALVDAMTALAVDPRAVFVGQTVVAGGAAVGETLHHIPVGKRLEFPVAENLQAGFCTGLALAGWLPICIFPRINFLLEALPQLVQHLDRLYDFGNGFRPRVIIRTAVASPLPLDPGPQHLGDPSIALRALLHHIRVIGLPLTAGIAMEYERAAKFDGSTILIEYLARYDDE